MGTKINLIKLCAQLNRIGVKNNYYKWELRWLINSFMVLYPELNPGEVAIILELAPGVICGGNTVVSIK